jgi:hypothetical protein
VTFSFDEFSTGVTYAARLRAELPALFSHANALDAFIPGVDADFVGDYHQILISLAGFALPLPLPQAIFRATLTMGAAMDAELPTAWGARLLDTDGGALIGTLPTLTGRFAPAAPLSIEIGLPPLKATMALEYDAQLFVDGLEVNDPLAIDFALLFASLARFADKHTWVGYLNMLLSSSLTARDTFAFVFQSVFIDRVTLTDPTELELRMVIALADVLVANDVVATQLDGILLFVAAVLLRDKLTPGFDLRVTDLASFVDALDDAANMLIALLDQLELQDVQTASLSAVTFFSSDVKLAASSTTSLSALIELLDQADLSVRFRLPDHDGDLFVGYALNLRNAGATRYTNYPFTSFAVVGGMPFASGPDGLYMLLGDDDAGQPIPASIYTGLTTFGTELLKKVPNAWIVYTATGKLMLKVATTDRGAKKENWYELSPREYAAPAGERFDIAKGLVSQAWGFTIANVDGADFQVDTLRIWPLALQRRQSGR